MKMMMRMKQTNSIRWLAEVEVVWLSYHIISTHTGCPMATSCRRLPLKYVSNTECKYGIEPEVHEEIHTQEAKPQRYMNPVDIFHPHRVGSKVGETEITWQHVCPFPLCSSPANRDQPCCALCVSVFACWDAHCAMLLDKEQMLL